MICFRRAECVISNSWLDCADKKEKSRNPTLIHQESALDRYATAYRAGVPHFRPRLYLHPLTPSDTPTSFGTTPELPRVMAPRKLCARLTAFTKETSHFQKRQTGRIKMYDNHLPAGVPPWTALGAYIALPKRPMLYEGVLPLTQELHPCSRNFGPRYHSPVFSHPRNI